MTTDTTTAAENLQNEIFMRLSGVQKVRLAMAFSDTVRDITWAGFHRRHPLVSENVLQAMFLEEMHGIKLTERSKGQGNE
jgi:hypothetical protein